MNAYAKSILFGAMVLCLARSEKTLPSFIKVCHRSDPKLAECVLASAKIAIPEIVKGVKEFNIPSLSPLKIQKVDFETGENLKLVITDLAVGGLDTATLVTGRLDPKTNKIHMEIFFQHVDIRGSYEINGRILVLPIQGKGPIELLLNDVTCKVVLPVEFYEKDGETYANVKPESITFDEKIGKVKLDNLFNGDKTLGEHTNKFINENWSDVRNELLPAIVKVTETIAVKIVNSFLNNLPYDLIYPE